jgi:hypothetical protein
MLVRFEVFTAVTMKNVVCWDVTPCGSCKNRRLGGTWRLLHQDDKNRWSRNNTSCNWYFFVAYVGCQLQLVLLLVHRFLSPWWRRRQVPPRRRFLQEPHGVTSQKTTFFISCLVRRTSKSPGLIWIWRPNIMFVWHQSTPSHHTSISTNFQNSILILSCKKLLHFPNQRFPYGVFTKIITQISSQSGEFLDVSRMMCGPFDV